MAKKKKLDDFHYHESLDRTYLIAQMMDDFLLSHPVFKKHKKLRKDVEKAQMILAEVYQNQVNCDGEPSEILLKSLLAFTFLPRAKSIVQG